MKVLKVAPYLDNWQLMDAANSLQFRQHARNICRAAAAGDARRVKQALAAASANHECEELRQLLSLPVYLRCASEFVCIIDAAASAAATARGLSGGGSSSSGARGCWDWCRYELENFAADPSAPRTILTTDPTAGTAIASFAVHGRSAARQLQDKGLLPKRV